MATKPPGSKPNYFYSVFSVTLVLFLLGLFGLLVLQGNQGVKTLKEQAEIIIELQEDTSPEQVDELKNSLSKMPYYKPSSLRFVSKEDGAKLMKQEYGDDFLRLDMANPLYDVVIFNMKAEYFHADSLAAAKLSLTELGGVSDVFYQESVADSIAANLRKISIFVLAAGLFFILVAVALILNTIRLALYANRFLIKNMELVGASWGFISRPFLRRSFRQGLLSGLLAVLGLGAMLYFLYKNDPNYQDALFLAGIGILFLGILLLGVLITVLSTYFVVNKYLRMREDEMY